MTRLDTTTDPVEEFVRPCSRQLYPAHGLQPAEWCCEDAEPGTDRCPAHLFDDEEGDRS